MTAWGVALALGASIVWAGANVFVQRSARQLGDVRAMFWAQLVGGTALLPLAALAPPVRAPDPVDLAVTGLGSAFGYYGMLRGFRLAPLSVATPLVASWALPAAVCGVVWSGEEPRLVQAVGALLVIAGAAGNGALARGGEWMGPKAEALGWTIAGSVGFGVMAAGVARMQPALGEVLVIPAAWACQWVLLAPVLLRRLPERPPAWGNVVALALLEAVGFVLYAVATATAPVSVVSPPASLSPLFTVAWAAVVLREPVGAVRWGMIALAVVGTVLLAS